MTELLLQSVLVGFLGLGLGYTMAELDGPFSVASGTRRLLQSERLPAWAARGADCPFCWSMWTCLGGALLVGASTGSASIGVMIVSWLVGFGVAVFLLKYVGY